MLIHSDKFETTKTNTANMGSAPIPCPKSLNSLAPAGSMSTFSRARCPIHRFKEMFVLHRCSTLNDQRFRNSQIIAEMIPQSLINREWIREASKYQDSHKQPPQRFTEGEQHNLQGLKTFWPIVARYKSVPIPRRLRERC